MSRLRYRTIITVGTTVIAVAIWQLGASQTLFPGLMAVFSFYLICTTGYSRLRRENPDILVFPAARGLLGNDAKEITIWLSNPGVLTGVLTRIDYLGNNKSRSEVTWNWKYLHPMLTPRGNNVDPTGALPVPLLPGGLVVLHTTTEIDVPENAYLYLTFKIGGYKEKTIKFRAKDVERIRKNWRDYKDTLLTKVRRLLCTAKHVV